MSHSHASASSSPGPGAVSPASSASASSATHWSVFLDHYDATASSIRRSFDLLAAVRDVNTQRRLADDVEQDIFDGKQQIESFELETHHFPYHLRSKALAQIQHCKEQLEQHYARLILYQQKHKLGQALNPQQLQREQQAASDAQHSNGAVQLAVARSPPDQHTNGRVLDDDNVDDTTRLLSPSAFSSSSASPSPTSASASPSAAPAPSRPAPFPMSSHRAALVSTAGHRVDFNEAANRTHASLLQSADIGQETGRLLAQQRESLRGQQGMLHESDAMSAESSRSMDRIYCRRISDNFIAWLIVVLQIGLFCLIARVKYFSY